MKQIPGETAEAGGLLEAELQGGIRATNPDNPFLVGSPEERGLRCIRRLPEAVRRLHRRSFKSRSRFLLLRQC